MEAREGRAMNECICGHWKDEHDRHGTLMCMVEGCMCLGFVEREEPDAKGSKPEFTET